MLSDSIDRKFKEIKTRLAAAWGQESGTWGEVWGKGMAKRHKETEINEHLLCLHCGDGFTDMIRSN